MTVGLLYSVPSFPWISRAFALQISLNDTSNPLRLAICSISLATSYTNGTRHGQREVSTQLTHAQQRSSSECRACSRLFRTSCSVPVISP